MAFVKPVIVKEISMNAKIGPVSATYVAQGSCPASCPFYNNGCYAQGGKVGIITNGLNAHNVQDPVTLATMEADLIRDLTGRQDLRLHIVGDCKTEEAARIVSEAADAHRAKRGARVWTYTHAHDVPREAWGKVSVLRSCENMDQVKQAHADGYAAELTVGEFEKDTAYDLGDGYTGIPCPQQTGKAATCVDCGLCMMDEKLRNRKNVILLAAHGMSKKKVATAVQQAQHTESFAYVAE